MGQFLPEQKYHFAIEASVASMMRESGSEQAKNWCQTAFRSLLLKMVGRALPVLEVRPSRAYAGLATISRYAEKCGGRHEVDAAGTTGNAHSAAGFSAARVGVQVNSSLMETWAGRTARASLIGALAGLRASGEYVRMSTGAVGRTGADADGAKEIDCYV
jgi:hypothetical protein